MFTSPGSVAFSIGPFTVHWYGIIIASAIMAAYALIHTELKRRKMDTVHAESILFATVICGVLGARLYYVLFNFSQYAASPLQILYVWKGGLAIHGALIGGGLAFFLYARLKKLPILQYLDIMLPAVLLAQAIGRWGNFFNNEAFGTPTDVPWKLYIPPQRRPDEYAASEYFHPAFLYESLWNLLGVVLLLALSRRASVANKQGFITSIYLMWYSLGRFFIEALRTDSLYLGPLRTAQVASILFFITGCVGVAFLLRNRN